MRKICILFAAFSLVVFAGTAMAAKFDFHGDLNNRFMVYTDQAQWFTLDKNGKTSEEKSKDSWGEIKYRLWVEAATDDDSVKGVYAIELGALRFGKGGDTGRSTGGSFSGDGVNIETRWAYTDLAIPPTGGRAKVGLLPVSLNSFFWEETAMGVLYEQGGLTAGWLRGSESVTTTNQNWGEGDLDALIARYDYKQDVLKFGVFGAYLTEESSDPFADYSPAKYHPVVNYQIKSLGKTDLGIGVVGVDGSYQIGKGFINWDAIYETGSLNDISTDNGATKADYDLSAYLLHLDAGINIDQARLTFTTWYASGDDDDNDTDLNGYISVDEDRFDSIIFMEGGYTDDTYFTERPYIGDKGLFLNKLAVDYKATDKLKVGGAVLYLQTAEDIKYVDDKGVARADKNLGVELDAYLSYQLFKNCEVAVNAGYLFADDAMDYFEVTGERDGKADNDIFRSTARIRYKF